MGQDHLTCEELEILLTERSSSDGVAKHIDVIVKSLSEDKNDDVRVKCVGVLSRLRGDPSQNSGSIQDTPSDIFQAIGQASTGSKPSTCLIM